MDGTLPTTAFRLTDGVQFAVGAHRGALYDTNTKNVYSLNSAAVAVLKSQDTMTRAFWQELVRLGLAERTNAGAPCDEITGKHATPTLDFVWFEIMTDNCNEKCLHCYSESGPTRTKSHSLSIIDSKLGQLDAKSSLPYSRWRELIIEARELGAVRCQFIGGEPFLFRDNGRTVLDLVSEAKSVGFEQIEIFTNGTMLTEDKISRIKDLGVSVAISLYSVDPDVHDSITQTPGSHRLTIWALKSLQMSDIPTRVAVVAMRQNEHTLEDTISYIESMGLECKPDPVRPQGRGKDENISPSAFTTKKYGIMNEPKFIADKSTIDRYRSMHSCLAGEIAIASSGQVYPCIFSRNQDMGHVAHMPLRDVVNADTTRDIWTSTKDSVVVCKDCEYRYVCFDCRPISSAAAGDASTYLNAPFPRCSYNPYHGVWGQGTWEMSDEGPCYTTNTQFSEPGGPTIRLVSGHADQKEDSACAPHRNPCNPQCSPRCSPSCQPCFPFGKCQPQVTPRC